MLHLRAYLFLFLVIGITHFAVCDVNCDEEVAPGSEETTVSFTEQLSLMKRIQNRIMGKIFSGKHAITGKHGFVAPEVKEKSSYGQVLNRIAVEMRIIYPGTLWCGDGSIAQDDSELGTYNKTDACCRDHDKCQSNIEAGGTKVNLINNGAYTRSACHCDTQFYECLKASDDGIASSVGATYFDVLGPQCFECVCPNDSCPVGDNTDCKGHCARYQWSDNPGFGGGLLGALGFSG